jgi:hypothetical protein
MKIIGISKTEAKVQIAAIGKQLLEVETECAAKDVDFRPWNSQDHPLAVQHWKLAQRRIALKELLKKPAFSPERRQAASLRMSARRESSLDRATQAISRCQDAV